MKTFQGPSIAQVLCLLCLVTLLALTAEADKTASIVNQYYNNDGNGNFANGFETSNGINSEEEGVFYPGPEPESGTFARSGFFSYDWEGVTYKVYWSADEDGFQPRGDHLPDYGNDRKPIEVPYLPPWAPDTLYDE